MSGAPNNCERCGQPALVHITGADAQGQLVRHLCLQCAAEEDSRSSATSESYLNFSAILLTVGGFVLAISLLADVFRFGEGEAFGWKQWLVVLISAIMILAGAIIRVPSVVAVAVMIGSIGLLADMLGFGSSEGFGYQQIAGCILGLAFVILGLNLSLRKRSEKDT